MEPPVASRVATAVEHGGLIPSFANNSTATASAALEASSLPHRALINLAIARTVIQSTCTIKSRLLVSLL